jgi:hypothetical protein
VGLRVALVYMIGFEDIALAYAGDEGKTSEAIAKSVQTNPCDGAEDPQAPRPPALLSTLFSFG